MDIAALVIGTCEEVGQEQQKKLVSLTPDLPLLDSGLDSLCLAVIVARLEDRLGFDPFDTEEDVELPVTVGDFIKFYEDAAARSPG
jgi:acyl carrier protein